MKKDVRRHPARGCSCEYRNGDVLYDVYHSSHKQTNNRHELSQSKKEGRELNMAQAGQRTETLGIIFMFVVSHGAKICAYAIDNKSNLH